MWGSSGVAPSKHGGSQWHENAPLRTPGAPVSTESCTPRGPPPWVQRRQGVCGPEQACARASIAPPSLVVAEADRVPQQGRQPQPQRSRVRLCGLCRGASPRARRQGTLRGRGSACGFRDRRQVKSFFSCKITERTRHFAGGSVPSRPGPAARGVGRAQATDAGREFGAVQTH